ncbi:MAG: hypothetical protein ACOYO0_14400, partial [Sandarakinorhabdus sp.]
PPDMPEKIALFCNVERDAVIEERDKTVSIYEVPVSLSQNRLDQLIVEKLIKGCGAPASLRLMYPGEVKPAKTTATTARRGFGTKAD